MAIIDEIQRKQTRSLIRRLKDEAKLHASQQDALAQRIALLQRTLNNYYGGVAAKRLGRRESPMRNEREHAEQRRTEWGKTLGTSLQNVVDYTHAVLETPELTIDKCIKYFAIIHERALATLEHRPPQL